MGTSGSYPGPSPRDPLVPSWADDDGMVPGPLPPIPMLPDGNPPPDGARPPPPMPPAPRERRPMVPAPDEERFRDARTNFTRFSRSGGNDRKSLGRAISGYVSTSSGGARHAAQRMGSSRRAGARLLGFLSDARARGAIEALRALDLEQLAGRPIEEIFLGLADYVCPASGSVDDAIARDAFIETIVDLAALGIGDLNSLTAEQLQTVFELYATHAIEARICNEIGSKSVRLPEDVRAVERVQAVLRDFIRRAVGDALGAARAALTVLTPDRVLGFVDEAYEAAFNILITLGDKEAET